MIRLADLPDWDRHAKLEKLKELTGFDARPWVQPPPLERCRVAIVTTAGLHRRSDRPFGPSATDYRIIPGDTAAADLVMSRQSVSFDRTGFQEDHNVAFPVDRLHALAQRADRGRTGIHDAARAMPRRRGQIATPGRHFDRPQRGAA